jgi:ATP-dependent Clp protease ATP-binding subunit ClpC
MVRDELKEREISVELTEPVREYLGENGFDPVLGARPLRRLIQNEVEDRLSDELLGGKFEPGDTAIVDMDEDGKVCIKVRKAETAALPVA